MIKVTLEFHSVPEAIIALNAIMNLPEVKATPVAAAIAEVKAARRGRADKGQKRGEYKPRTESVVPETTSARQLHGASATAEVLPAAPGTDTAPTLPGDKAIPPLPVAAPAGPATTIGEKDAEAQKAMETLHGKKGLDACRVLLGQFGVSRIREIPTARRSEFLEEAGKAAA